VLLEDHNFYIDQRGFSALRVPCLAIGRGLAEPGTIDSPEDVFYLYESEIKDAAANPNQRFAGVASARRAERERWLRVLPPAQIGAGQVEMPIVLERFFGATPEESDDKSLINGIAGSPGVISGVARLVLTLDEVDRLSPGEILVTYATAPPWTPLFGVASAVVTDVGGRLSHCAIVAREYGIPAVVGTKTATARIYDGMRITVDGSRGIVRLDE
jgi:pyruvate,water dikinase